MQEYNEDIKQSVREAVTLSKVLIFIFLLLASIFCIIYALSKTPLFQNWAKDRIISMVNKESDNKISIGDIHVDIVSGLDLKNVLLLDHHTDTIFFGREMQVGLKNSLFSLFSNSLEIKKVEIDTGVFKIISYAWEERNSLNHFLKHFKKKKKSPPNASPFHFVMEEVSLNEFRYQRTYQESSRNEYYSVKQLNAVIDQLNTKGDYLLFENAQLIEPKVCIYKNEALQDSNHIVENIKSDTIIDPDIICDLPFIVQIKNAEVRSGSFTYDDGRYPKSISKVEDIPFMDYRHFGFGQINAKIQGFIYNDLDFWGRLLNFTALSNDGFLIKNMQVSDGFVTSKSTQLNNFRIETEKSLLQDTLEFKYANYESFLDFEDKIFLNFRSNKSQAKVSEIAYFFKELSANNFFKKNREETIYLEGHLNGKINSLKSPRLSLKFGDKISFKGNLASRNLANFGEELLNIKVEKLESSITNLEDLFSGLKFPVAFKKIGKFSFTGNFDGYIGDFVSYGKFNTDIGTAKTDIKLNLRPGNEKAEFSGSLDFINFDLGELINMPDLKQVYLKTNVKNGLGLTWETLNANLSANLESALFKGKEYRNLNFNGVFTKSLLNGKLKMEDDHLNFAFDGKIYDLNKVPKFDFKANIAKLDLNALNLTKQKLVIQSEIDINMSGKSIDDILGDLNLKNTILFDEDKKTSVKISQIQSSIRESNSRKYLNVNSNFGKLQMDGHFTLSKIYNDICAILKVNIPSLPLEIGAGTQLLDVKYDFELDKSKNLFDFIDLPLSIERGRVSGEINSISNKMTIKSNIETLAFKGIIIDEIAFQSNWENAQINSNIFLEDINFYDRFKLPNLSVLQKGNSTQSQISLFSIDSFGHSKNYEIVGLLEHNAKFVSLKIPSNQFLFDNNFWYLAEKNEIAYAKGNLFLKNLSMTDSSRYVAISNFDQKGLKLNIDGFDVASFNSFINAGNIKFSGLFNLELVLENYNKVSNIRSHINIFQFHINKSNYGPLSLNLFLPNGQSPLNVEFSNQYRDYDISGVGTINIPIANQYKLPKYDSEFLCELKNAPASLLQDFIPGISNTRGGFNGHAFVNLKNKKLYLNGDLMCDKLVTKIDYLGASISCPQGKVAFVNDKISFNNLSLFDELNNPMQLNGYLTHRNLNSFYVNCNVKSEKALILNTNKNINPDYYGYGICKFRANFEGNLSKVNISVTATALKGSKLVIPVNYDQSSESKDFVVFVKHELKDSSSMIKPIDVKGMNLNMDLSITEAAEVQIVFDETAGDIMKGFGEGNLQIASLRDNSFSMTGDYIVEHGEYLFTLLNVVNKPFKIRRGGTIKWTGDPLNADINLETKYDGLYSSVSTFLQEYLIDLPDASDDALNRTEVDLLMLLKGSLLKPDISFKLGFPALTGQLKNFSDIKLNELEANPDLLNQQVFGLLVFGTFLNTSNPFQTGIIKNLTSSGINTLSEMLSSQFSLFATNLLSEAFGDVKFISGVDVNVAYDVSEDPLLATNRIDQGEFVFSLRHRLWNDKWAVTLGGNYKTSPSLYGNTNFNPESVIEWNTPVSGLKLRVYYKSDDSFSGVKHKVGSGVTYRREFDSLIDFKNALKDRFRGKKSS